MIKCKIIGFLFGLTVLFLSPAAQFAGPKPNVLFVITDDQGYGDLSCHGNPVLKTPCLDRLYSQSIRFTNFHVAPVCTPTRAAIMSGRYPMRGGISSTIGGESLLRNDGPAMADFFRESGYRTAMFGKWHLGENAPCRPEDRGFEHVIRLGGGGIVQTPDAWNNTYFNDRYTTNGKLRRYRGYCTDVFCHEAMSWIKSVKDKPFFVYLSLNAPHAPFNVAGKYSKPFRDAKVPELVANFYGMIVNIDENIGRLMAFLGDNGLEENTILIFTTDNGSAAGCSARAKKVGWNGWDGGRRGSKGDVTEGGHNVPFFIRWPGGGLGNPRDIDALTAHIDLLPTFIDICGLKNLTHQPFDGRSIRPLLEKREAEWPERTLFTGIGRRWAVMTDRWRLVTGNAKAGKWDLYDIKKDPHQDRNVAGEYPEIVGDLAGRWKKWYDDAHCGTRERVAIRIGDKRENPAVITAHDWAFEDVPEYSNAKHNVPWNQFEIKKMPWVNGTWTIQVAVDGRYEFTLCSMPYEAKYPLTAKKAKLVIGDKEYSRKIEPEWVGSFNNVFKNAASTARFTVDLKKGRTTLRTSLVEQGGRERGAFYVYVKRLEK